MPAATTFDKIFGTHRGFGRGSALDDPHPSHRAQLHLDHLLSLVASGSILAGLDELGTDNHRIERAPLLSKLESGVAEALSDKIKAEWAPNIANFARVIGFAPNFLERPLASEELGGWVTSCLHAGRDEGISPSDLMELAADRFAEGIIRATASISQQDPHLWSEDMVLWLSHEDWCDIFSPYFAKNPISGSPDDVSMLQRAFHASLDKMLNFRSGRSQDCGICGRFRARFNNGS